MFYSDFGLFYQVPMQSGALFNVTQTTDTYVFLRTYENGNIGMSGTGFYQSMVGFVLITRDECKLFGTSKENVMF